MGKVIVCAGEYAKKPYVFQSSKVCIYTIEELCHYIYHNIEGISEELYGEELTAFIGGELKLVERAAFIDGLRMGKANLKDMIVGILCSCDYYGEKEIKDFLNEIDILYGLMPIQRRKRNADMLMKKGEYGGAARAYRQILNSNELAVLTDEECGDIMHNAAVIDARTGDLFVAAEGFREAYERNHRPESLMQYLFALELTGQHTLYRYEVGNLSKMSGGVSDVGAEYKACDESFYKSAEYANYKRIASLKEDGKFDEFYNNIRELLEDIKSEYRKDGV